MATELASSSGTSISTTEYSILASSTTLTASTTAGIIQTYLDLNALVLGDQYVVKIYEKIVSGATKRVLAKFYFTGVQPQPIVVLPAIALMFGWDVTVQRLAGADRSIGWSIRSVSTAVTQVSNQSSGTSITNTEYSILNASTTFTPSTTAGVYQVLLDLNSMVTGDQYQFRVYEKTASASTQRALFDALIYNAQLEPIFVIPAQTLINGWNVGLKRLSASSRSLGWSIRKVG